MGDTSVDTQPEAPWDEHGNGRQSNGRTLIGDPPNNHWLHSNDPSVFDLTRPDAPDFARPSLREAVTIETTSSTIVLSPAKTALVIIDMQNFFLSTALGRKADGAGNHAKQQLLDHALPACAAAGIQVIWLNWGLTRQEIKEMPPSVLRAFGSTSKTNADGHLNEMGIVELDDGTTVDAGPLLMRDTWNADLPPDLKKVYKSGLQSMKPDIWIHKNRMSGLWGMSTPCTEFLDKQGIRTLMFAGVNTDQCVGGSLQDAYSKGFDCILLKDGCGTTSPQSAQECIEYNAAKSWGFVTDCKTLKTGVDNMLRYR